MITLADVKEISDKIAKLKILVIGDCMLDETIFGSVERLSQEAPVPLLRQQAHELEAGGAAAVANMCRTLGAETDLITRIGGSETCDLLLNRVGTSALDGIIRQSEYQTPKKTRIWGGIRGGSYQQLVRIDDEPQMNYEFRRPELLQNLWTAHRNFGKWNAVIVSDYHKGFITRDTLDLLRTLLAASEIPAYFDPPNDPEWRSMYRGFGYCAVPNRKKAKGWNSAELQGTLKIPAVVVTLDADGCEHTDKSMSVHRHLPMGDQPIHARDVTGAGDQFIAALTCSKTAGFCLGDACDFANLAAGLQIQRIGHTSVTCTQIGRALMKLS